VFASRHAVFAYDDALGLRLDGCFASAVMAEARAEALAGARVETLVVGPEQPQRQWINVTHVVLLETSVMLTCFSRQQEIDLTRCTCLSILDFENESVGGRSLLLSLHNGTKFFVSTPQLSRAVLDDLVDACANSGLLLKQRRFNPLTFGTAAFFEDTHSLALGVIDAIDRAPTALGGPLSRHGKTELALVTTPPWLASVWYFVPLASLPVALLELTSWAVSPSWETGIHGVTLTLWASVRFLWSQWFRNQGFRVPPWPLNLSEQGIQPSWPGLFLDASLVALGGIFYSSSGWPGLAIEATALLAIASLGAAALTVRTSGGRDSLTDEQNR
jgi:hypothetical protein